MQVLYVDVVHDEGLAQLQSVSAAIATKFREADLLGHEEGQEFTAHLTVAKLSALRRQGKRRRSAVKKLPQVLCPAHFGHVLSVISCGQNNGSTLHMPPPGRSFWIWQCHFCMQTRPYIAMHQASQGHSLLMT